MKKTFIFSLMMTLFIYVGCKIDSEEPTPNATTTSSDEQLLNAAQQAQKGAIIWEFSAPSNDWIETNQNSKPNCYKIQHSPGCTNGGLIIHTDANTSQRNKLKTVKQYGAGVYEWRLYVPKLEKGAQTSVNCFLYKDDEHELAIKVYSGKSSERSQMRLNNNQVIAELSGYGIGTKKIAITQEDWYKFKIELQLVNAKYHAILSVDGRGGKDKFEGTLNYGQGVLFNIFCSVENLEKVGDKPATTPTTGVWDNVKYTPNNGAVIPTPMPDPKPKNIYEWNFKNPAQPDWIMANQNDNKDIIMHKFGVYDKNVQDKAVLQMDTRKGMYDRTKVKTIQTFKAGIYTWRAYIPPMKIGDQVSVGSWLYNDDHHELDFEVGPGTDKDRNTLRAKGGDAIVFITSQGNPFDQQKVLITEDAWHTFQIILKLNARKHYVVTWRIDGKDCFTRELHFGEEHPFHIFCSVENLKFLGDHPTTQNYTGVWDFVKYEPL